MPIPWLTALKSIPWGNVMEHAPKVLDKARNYMSSKENDTPSAPVEKVPEGELETQLALALSNIKTLQQQIKSLSEKMTQLSDQHSAIKSEVGRLRQQDRWQKALIVLILLLVGGCYSLGYFKLPF
jgi:FtsZ-binding cell division protein ZapB